MKIKLIFFKQAFILVCFLFLSREVKAQYTVSQANQILQGLKDNSVQDYREAVLRFDTLYAVYKKNQLNCKLIHVLTLKSICLGNLSRHEEAMQAIIEADKLFKKFACTTSVKVFIYRALSGAYGKQNETHKSDSFCKLGLSLWKEEDGEIANGIYLYFGLADDSNLADALGKYQKALDLAVKYKLEDLELTAINNIGFAYAMNDEYDMAYLYFSKALPLAKKRKAYKEIAMLYNNLAGLTDNMKIQGSYIDSSLYFIRKSGKFNDILQYTENKALYLYDIQKYKLAYLELYKALNLKDSVFSEKQLLAITEMQQKYESEKQANTIQKLKLDKLDSELNSMRFKRTQSYLILGACFLLLIAGFMTYSFLNVKKNRNQLAVKNLEIEKARQASEELLLNILPEEVANELKLNGVSESRQFDQVSILFTDFVDFTKLSELLSPVELVDELNMCFKTFDLILEKYNIEKIKTIGDAYMAAGNIPVPIDHCAKNTILAALEMQEFITNRHSERSSTSLPSFEMRVGINVGTVVAGIVGLKKFQYDIWGDTVNTAARLESEGMAGKVNISASTYELVKHDPLFEFTFRGRIQAKGKGEIDMYFVNLKSEA